jgi:hypothetical protein
MNIVEILRIQYPNARTPWDYQVAMDEKGNQYISYWNLSEPIPTVDQLSQLSSTLDLQVRQKEITDLRSYPPISRQLDMMYWDKVNNTTVWQDTIAAIKLANPKPTV